MNHIEVQVVNPQLLQGLLAGLEGQFGPIRIDGTETIKRGVEISKLVGMHLDPESI